MEVGVFLEVDFSEPSSIHCHIVCHYTYIFTPSCCHSNPLISARIISQKVGSQIVWISIKSLSTKSAKIFTLSIHKLELETFWIIRIIIIKISLNPNKVIVSRNENRDSINIIVVLSISDVYSAVVSGDIESSWVSLFSYLISINCLCKIGYC